MKEEQNETYDFTFFRFRGDRSHLDRRVRCGLDASADRDGDDPDPVCVYRAETVGRKDGE